MEQELIDQQALIDSLYRQNQSYQRERQRSRNSRARGRGSSILIQPNSARINFLSIQQEFFDREQANFQEYKNSLFAQNRINNFINEENLEARSEATKLMFEAREKSHKNLQDWADDIKYTHGQIFRFHKYNSVECSLLNQLIYAWGYQNLKPVDQWNRIYEKNFKILAKKYLFEKINCKSYQIHVTSGACEGFPIDKAKLHSVFHYSHIQKLNAKAYRSGDNKDYPCPVEGVILWKKIVPNKLEVYAELLINVFQKHKYLGIPSKLLLSGNSFGLYWMLSFLHYLNQSHPWFNFELNFPGQSKQELQDFYIYGAGLDQFHSQSNENKAEKDLEKLSLEFDEITANTVQKLKYNAEREKIIDKGTKQQVTNFNVLFKQLTDNLRTQQRTNYHINGVFQSNGQIPVSINRARDYHPPKTAFLFCNDIDVAKIKENLITTFPLWETDDSQSAKMNVARYLFAKPIKTILKRDTVKLKKGKIIFKWTDGVQGLKYSMKEFRHYSYMTYLSEENISERHKDKIIDIIDTAIFQ